MRERTRRKPSYTVASVGTTSSGKSTKERCSCSRRHCNIPINLVTRLRSERRNGLLPRFSESSSTLRRLSICRENSSKSTKEKEKRTGTSTRRSANAYESWDRHRRLKDGSLQPTRNFQRTHGYPAIKTDSTGSKS